MNEIDAAGAASLLGVSRQHFVDRISKLPDFPRPVVAFTARSRRWRYADVLAWRGKRRDVKQAA